MKIKLILFSLLLLIIKTVPPNEPLPFNYFEKETLKTSNLKLSYLSAETNSSLDKINYTISYIFNSEGHEAEYFIILQPQNLQPRYYYSSYSIGLNGNGNFSIIDVNFKLNNATYEFKNNIITFNFKLFNNEKLEINFKYKVVNKTLNKFHRYEYVYLPKTNYYGEIIVSTKDDMTIINTNNDIVKKIDNSNKYIWKGNLNEEIIDTLRIGYTSGKWSIVYKATLTSKTGNQIKNGFIRTPRFFKGGNNIINNYTFSSSISNNLDGINIIDNSTHFIFEFKDVKQKEVFSEIKTDFTNIGNITWNYYFDDFPSYKPKSTSTELTKKKVNEILSKDKSTDPDYIKIGKWVYQNMIYDISHTGKRKTVDEILTTLIGVCEHYTILYNALLNSINIEAIYVGGFAFDEEKQIKKENMGHAWTLAKINNEWIPYDSTWNIFTGILPISHIYERFNSMYIYYSSGYTFSDKIDIQFNKADNVIIEENKSNKYFIIVLVIIFVIICVGLIVYCKICKAPSSSVNNDNRNPFTANFGRKNFDGYTNG